ncbi:MAG: hypothetical protein OXC28_04890 [Defluviicoccus sp.]|nr:hypothetical protein [Defluviicoccus sp.]
MQIDTAALEAALGRLSNLPAKIDAWRVETGTDWTDDPAIWIWGILNDANIDTDTHAALRAAILATVRQQTDPEIGVFIRFRATSEMAQAT